MSTQTRVWKPVLVVGLAAVAFAVSAIIVTVAKKLGMIEPVDAKRIGLIAIGLVLVVAGNAIPKLRLFERQGFPPARAIAAQRLSGWALVMAGLAVDGFWIFSASAETLLASALAGLAAFAITGAAWVWLISGPREPVAKADGDGVITAARHAFVYILLGLFWTFAVFLADYLWGDDVSMWMSIVFAVGIAITPAALRAKRWRA